jgi:glyoxylase-like metal-dependent hydrolase (beta-lactamase superfamily II)
MVSGAAPPVLELGDLRVTVLNDGFQRLDGGAMFGVVPKPLWERRIAPDERNRIRLALRCLLVEGPGGPLLVDTGIGPKERDRDPRFWEIYGVERDGGIAAGLAERGLAPADVRVVLNTHLHFDHAGGNTYRDAEGTVKLSFPDARHFVQRGEWEYAHSTNERTRASYLPDNFQPVADAGRFTFMEGEGEVLPGVSVILTPGHTPHHQSVLVQSGGEAACFMADVIPTMAHLPLPWIMGYDVEPLVTLESKRSLLRRAADERWLLVSVHDPTRPWGYAVKGDREVTVEDV